MMRWVLLLAVPLVLPGCVARTAANVVTLPVRAVGQTADWMTTSQDEADRNRGREIRKQEKREAKERRRAEKAARRHPR
ncbi:hypothetical protein ACMT1E_10085 [Sphingomonas flavalba]|uniref:hypothetical protein n=1 Tax=Sphingomonas flavalba TaxID=2559804 RepID=UPI0039E0C5FF